MGRIILIFIFFISFRASALVPENIFQNDLEIIELLGNKVRVAKENKDIPFSIEKIDRYLKDPDNKVNKLFKIDPYFYKDVKFWFYIYTVFHSHHVVLHDKENLSLIYDVLEFNEIKNSKALNVYTRFALQKRLTKERVRQLKKDFIYLQKKKPKNNSQRKIISALKKVGFRIPKPSSKRVKLFSNLGNNLRTQTGQKDSIQNGIYNFAPYSKTFMSWLKYFNLPKELMWISFLESSFNTRARSKVGATGVWQFMRRIGRYFMPYNSTKDGRLSPVMSTLAAFHLLHQNKKILKRWDLAIPAYNSGTKHIIKARRRLKMAKPSLKKILSSYDHPHLGFASKNFYSEFLALSHAQAYKEVFYDIKRDVKNYKTINAYITKCSLSRSWLVSRLKKSSPLTKEFNSHLKSKKRSYKPGTVIFSDINLSKKRYIKLTLEQLRRRYPRNFYKLLKNQSCSTK